MLVCLDDLRCPEAVFLCGSGFAVTEVSDSDVRSSFGFRGTRVSRLLRLLYSKRNIETSTFSISRRSRNLQDRNFGSVIESPVWFQFTGVQPQHDTSRPIVSFSRHTESVVYPTVSL